MISVVKKEKGRVEGRGRKGKEREEGNEGEWTKEVGC
jgi:hypothetical protein